jgi:hypothetical protein
MFLSEIKRYNLNPAPRWPAFASTHGLGPLIKEKASPVPFSQNIKILLKSNGCN